MTRKKSRFWTLIFSFLPGAGEMYMGFMKMGVSLMGLFCGLEALAMFFGQSAFMTIAVIVWFYGFFHVHNLRAMDDEDFYALEDDYLFHLGGEELKGAEFVQKYRRGLALALIIFGVWLVCDNLVSLLAMLIPDFLRQYIYGVMHRVPQLIFGGLIIYAGFRMICGKKQELLEDTKEETEDGRREKNG